MLTLQYNNDEREIVMVFDNSGLIDIRNLDPGEVFSLVGPSGGKFTGNTLYLNVGGEYNAQITVNCSFQFDPSTEYGYFNVLSASSKDGGPLCCTSNNGANNPPVIVGCPADIQAVAGTNCTAAVTWTAPEASTCDVISFTSTHTPGAVFSVGTTRVIYTARNTNNITSTCEFNVVVKDETSPVVTTPVANVVVNAGTDCKAIATWFPPVFNDNCAVVSVTSTKTPGTLFSLGTTNVTYTAKDNVGNTGVFTFTVTVKDVTSPTVAACPAEVVANVTEGCQALVSWTPPVFADACGPIMITASHNPGSSFSVGTTEVTYTAKDNATNAISCKFNVIVKDAVPPVIAACPRDTTIVTSKENAIVSWVAPVAADPCSPVTVTSTHEPGDTFSFGKTNVIYTATDVSGNKASCNFNVTVERQDVDLNIVQIITPDGNNENDEWIIGNIENFDNNKVVVMDRWGTVIYSSTRYDNKRNVWNGENSNGKVVPSGTYFYTISVQSGQKVEEKRGFIEVVR